MLLPSGVAKRVDLPDRRSQQGCRVLRGLKLGAAKYYVPPERRVPLVFPPLASKRTGLNKTGLSTLSLSVEEVEAREGSGEVI